jgi:hypothetical protein
MQIIRGSLRRIVFLALPGVTLASRQIPAGPPRATDRPEFVPQAVICGFRRSARPYSRRGSRTGAATRPAGGV